MSDTIDDKLTALVKAISSDDNAKFHPKGYVDRLKALIANERIDEIEIWLSHSTSRRLVDTEPAIRTVDFQDRIAELKSPPTPPKPEGIAG